MKILREIVGAVRSRVFQISATIDLRDAHAYGGLLMLWYGLSQLSAAAAWAICGLILFWLGVRR